MGPTFGAELSSFIAYVACLGQSKMAELGYSPIPANLVLDDFQAAGRLPGGTEPPAPTPQNCQNPYITGALQSPGGPTVLGTTSNPGQLRFDRSGGAAHGGDRSCPRSSCCGCHVEGGYHDDGGRRWRRHESRLPPRQRWPS